MSSTSDDMDDFSWVQPRRNIACSVCKVADDVETLSSKLCEKIRDYHGVKAICTNLRTELTQHMEAHRELLDTKLSEQFELHRLKAVQEKLEKKLAKGQTSLAQLYAQLEEKETKVEMLADELRDRERTHATLCAAQEELSQATSFMQEVLLAHRHSAALEVFLCIPIIPDDSMELPTQSSHTKQQSGVPQPPARMQLKGLCTIYGLPFPNNSQTKGIPCEIALSVLTYISFLCNALCAVYHISCPHPLHVYAQAECAVVEDSRLRSCDLDPDIDGEEDERYVSVQHEHEHEHEYGGATTPRASRTSRFYYLSPGIRFPVGATVGGVPIGRSVNEHVRQHSSASEMPSLFTPSSKTAKPSSGGTGTGSIDARVNSRAPWELPSVLRDPEVEFTEDGWTRAAGGLDSSAPVRLVNNPTSRSTHPVLGPVSTDFPMAMLLLQEDVCFVVQHILGLCGYSGPCFPREAMLLNLQLAQKLCVKNASETAKYLSAHNLVEDTGSVEAAAATTAVNDVFTFAETRQQSFGPYSTGVSRYQEQLRMQEQYIRSKLQPK